MTASYRLAPRVIAFSSGTDAIVSPADRLSTPRRTLLNFLNQHSESAATRTASSGRNMKDLVHVAIGGGGCLLRTAAVLTRVQVGRVPVPPVMLAVRLFVLAVVLLRVAEKLCKSCDVLRSFPFTAGKSRHDPLEEPAVPVWILERCKRVVGTTLRVAPADARVVHGVVERAASVVKDLAYVDAARDR